MPPFTDHRPLDRRTFLGTLAGGLAGLGLLGCGVDGGAEGGDQGGAGDGASAGPWARRTGVQLYTVRTLMERDVPETLAAVAGIGYREVETAGLFGLTPAEFRDALDASGLVSPAGHMPIEALRQDLDAAVATARTLGQDWIIVPWLGEGERTAEGYRRVAGELNRFGAAAAEQGMRIGYHNHDFEFQPLPDGGRGYDILLAETDPEMVDIELDLYWAVKAGEDPVALFERDPGRFPLCHVKDLRDRQGAGTQTPVGEGEIDFARIFARADGAGLRHYFVEEDEPADPLASIRSSHGYLQRLTATEATG